MENKMLEEITSNPLSIAAAILGKKGGQVKNPRKAKASRDNGRKSKGIPRCGIKKNI
mgnify:FL=1